MKWMFNVTNSKRNCKQVHSKNVDGWLYTMENVHFATALYTFIWYTVLPFSQRKKKEKKRMLSLEINVHSAWISLYCFLIFYGCNCSVCPCLFPTSYVTKCVILGIPDLQYLVLLAVHFPVELCGVKRNFKSYLFSGVLFHCVTSTTQN